jgi:hypothetical protein
MHSIRRIAALVGVTALAGAFVSGPASADNAEVFLGSAAARGLNVKVVSPLALDGVPNTLQASLGSAFAEASSAQTAKAEGIGQLLPTLLASTKKTAIANAGESVNLPKGCAQAHDLEGIVNLGLACGSAVANVVNGLPQAHSAGSVAGLNVNGQTALLDLEAATTVVGDTLMGALDTVCDTLADTAEEVCDVTTTVKDLVTSILETETLNVAVGESTADVVTEAGKITSTSSASGAVVRLLPLPQVNGLPSTEPVATIEVSSAKATAAYDRVAGASTASADPAIVRVKFNTVLTQALGLNEIAVTPGQSHTILAGTPLESDIIVAGSTISDNNTRAVADGVKLHLLKPLGQSAAGALDGGIMLELAHAEAGVAGTPAVITPVETPRVIETPRAPAELPRTGGTPWIPVAGAGALALAAVVRRASMKAAASK